MENNESKNLKLEFNYELIDNIDLCLNNTKILRKTFDKNNVTYLINLKTQDVTSLCKLLLIVTSGQIKIYDLSPKDEEIEPGTDKPIGSKEAIDEN